ncbi:hypothetical protein F5X98DRAFT_383861 [Xylaria grammica]|nr:hypothetical protein F5X98DRAFT_383861 [Xylaria grammica]
MYFAAPENIDYVEGIRGQVEPPGDIWLLGCILTKVYTFMRGGRDALLDNLRKTVDHRRSVIISLDNRAQLAHDLALAIVNFHHIDRVDAREHLVAHSAIPARRSSTSSPEVAARRNETAVSGERYRRVVRAARACHHPEYAAAGDLQFPCLVPYTIVSTNDFSLLNMLELWHIICGLIVRLWGLLEVSFSVDDGVNAVGPQRTVALAGSPSSPGQPLQPAIQETNTRAPPPVENILCPELDIEVNDTEEDFYHRTGRIFAIEVLQPDLGSQHTRKPNRRLVSSSIGHLTSTPSATPSRIRIRSLLLIELLEKATGTTISPKQPIPSPAPRVVSVLFLYPFKLFVRYEEAILDYIGMVLNLTPGGLESSGSGQATDRLVPDKFLSDEGRTLAGLLQRLFEDHLESTLTIRRELRNCTRPNIFQKFLGGGRGCRGRENIFYLRGFWLESTGKEILVVEAAFAIPPWEGERPVRELSILPWKYCEPQKHFPDDSIGDWVERLKKEGQMYSQLRQGTVKFLDGVGTDEYDKTWEFRSEVIIDLEQAGTEARLLSWQGEVGARLPPIKSLSVCPGDGREVTEYPERVSFEDAEGYILDSIFDDISFDHQYFQRKLPQLLPQLDKFESPEEAESIDAENFVPFPRTASGFVFSSRKWILFELRFLKDPVWDDSAWAELQLPKGDKRALLAAVRGCHGDGAPTLGILPGKGGGCIILLQGSSGIGKTFTAEALAAKLQRPLYSITGSDLGKETNDIERSLNTIFNHGRRWNCIMLLDEADVYLRTRVNDSIKYNSLVGVFLRQLDWFPGIMILTTNVGSIDSAVIDRCQLRLSLPPLNKVAIKNLWERYCEETRLQRYVSESEAKDLKIKIGPDLSGWWESLLAIYDALKIRSRDAEKEAQSVSRTSMSRDRIYEAELKRREAAKLQNGDYIIIQTRHLDEARRQWDRFHQSRDEPDSSEGYLICKEVDPDLEYDNGDATDY